MIITMDKLDKYLRENIGFEKNKGSFELEQKKYHNSLKQDNLSIIKIIKLYYKYKKSIKKYP